MQSHWVISCIEIDPREEEEKKPIWILFSYEKPNIFSDPYLSKCKIYTKVDIQLDQLIAAHIITVHTK